jgi:hypothetical protein
MPRVPLHIPLPGRDDCEYCGDTPELHEKSEHIYNGKDYGPVWQCPLCQAYVGCHLGTHKALGRLATKELREWKMRAHAAFDPLWKVRILRRQKGWKKSRGKGYQWLAEQLGLPCDECHIGYFTIEQCKRVVEICTPYLRNIRRRNNA